MGNYDIDDLHTLPPSEFENLIKTLLVQMGFDASTTKTSGDGGIDIIALNDQPIIGGKYIIQCKRYAPGNNIGEPVIRDLYGVMHAENANKGIVITTSDYSKQAIIFARDKAIELLNGSALLTLINKYIDASLEYTPEEIDKAEGFLKNEPTDFRGIEWGCIIETLKDMIYLERDYLCRSIYYKIADSKKLGAATIEAPKYFFDETGHFYLVSIEFKGRGNYESLLDYLFKKHGKPHDFGNFQHMWFGNDINIELAFIIDQSNGVVVLAHKRLAAEVLDKLDPRGFDELASGIRGIKWGSKAKESIDLVFENDYPWVNQKGYKKSNDIYQFAGVMAIPSDYIFDNDRFYYASFDFMKRENYEAIVNFINTYYGDPYDVDLSYSKPSNKWRNDIFELLAYFIDVDDRGHVSITYLPIAQEVKLRNKQL